MTDASYCLSLYIFAIGLFIFTMGIMIGKVMGKRESNLGGDKG